MECTITHAISWLQLWMCWSIRVSYKVRKVFSITHAQVVVLMQRGIESLF